MARFGSVVCLRGFKAAEMVIVALGLVCGVALTMVLLRSALLVPPAARTLVVALTAINLIVLAGAVLPRPSKWMVSLIQVACALNWIAGIFIGCYSLGWLFKTNTSYATVIYMIAALMFVLWSAASRRVVLRRLAALPAA